MTARGQSAHNVLSVTPATPLTRFDPSQLPPYRARGWKRRDAVIAARPMRIEPEVTLGLPRYFKHSLRQNVTRKLLHRRRRVPQRRCLVFIGNRARTVAADRVPHAGFNAGTRRQPLEGVPP